MPTNIRYTRNAFELIARSVSRYILGFMTLVCLGALPTRSQTIATVSGPISAPTFVNIYWDASWDADNPTLPKAAMDSLTAAAINSSYMAGLAEYGITAPRFGGGFLASSSCGATAPTSVPVFDLFGTSLQGFVNCEVSFGGVPTGPAVIYNVIMPPATVESDLFGAVRSCTTSTFSAYHFHSNIFGGVPFTAIFANPGCGGLLLNLTHEMVEAASDPFPPINVLLSGSGEIADFCSGTAAFLSTFGKGTASPYWSNARQVCVTGFLGTLSPSIASITTSGIGAQMTVSLKGTGFGTLPVTQPIPATADLAYLAVQNKSEGWEAGNALDSNAILAKVASWTTTQIDLTGFTSPTGFLFNILPNELFNFVICNPASGSCTTTSMNLPNGAILSGISPAGGPAGGNTPVVIKGSGFAAPIQVKFGSQTATAPTLVSSTEVHANSPASLPGAAAVQVIVGTVPSSQEIFNYCAPAVFSLSPKSGPAAGGTQVTITGGCLTGAVSARFGTKTGSTMQVVNGSTITVKSPAAQSSQACGFVAVQVVSPKLNGFVLSNANANARFTYGNPADCAPDTGGDGTICDRNPNKCPRPRARSNAAPQVAMKNVRPSEAAGADASTAALRDAISRGLLQEVAPGNPPPTQYVTRGEFALALAQMFDFQEPKDSSLVFGDVDSHDLSFPAFRSVQPFLMAYPGPGSAYTFYEFSPVERQEAASAVVSILVHAGKLAPPRALPENRTLAKLKDAGDIMQKLSPSVGAALERGLLAASENHEFRPKAFLTRAEFALLLQQLEK